MNHKLNLSCSTAALAELRSFLQQNQAIFKLSEVDRHQVTLAVEEVCANLIIHSHACNPKEEIHLEVKELNKKIIVEITDKGDAFNLLDYKVPDLSQVIEEKRKGGIGILLVKKIMDEIEFESKNGKNICRLIKNFRP
ncbi:MAG: ATP-binding protein [Algoriphagus sp.]|jgi:serine/threonine-protein kinase RsbW|nr:ATP-binding protein [Algoriphagus sp.]MCE2778164.1 ATP-binding protein [Algoriphagus sp.]